LVYAAAYIVAVGVTAATVPSTWIGYRIVASSSISHCPILTVRMKHSRISNSLKIIVTVMVMVLVMDKVTGMVTDTVIATVIAYGVHGQGTILKTRDVS